VGSRERGADWRHGRHAFWWEPGRLALNLGADGGKPGACHRPPNTQRSWWEDEREPLRGRSQCAVHSHREDGTSPPAPSPFSPRDRCRGATMGKAGRGRGGVEDEWCSCPQCSTSDREKRNICFDFEELPQAQEKPESKKSIRLRRGKKKQRRAQAPGRSVFRIQREGGTLPTADATRKPIRLRRPLGSLPPR
jgi:hypothetical protein